MESFDTLFEAKVLIEDWHLDVQPLPTALGGTRFGRVLWTVTCVSEL